MNTEEFRLLAFLHSRRQQLSEALTDAAPATHEEAPPVGSGAHPEAGGEVAGGSGSEWVSAERFNGLMATVSRKDNELKALQAEMAELQGRLNSPTPSPQEQNLTDTSALETQVQELTQMLMAERLETAKSAALAKHPEAAPFADLIVASNPSDFEEMVAAIAERAKGLTPAQVEEVKEEAKAVKEAAESSEDEEAPVVGGGAAFDASGATAERVQQALDAGDWGSYLKAAWDRQVEQDPDLQLDA